MTDTELLELADLDADGWADYALEQGWGDGLPLIIPSEESVAAFRPFFPSTELQLPPVPPRRVVPTLRSLAANAVMAGCKPEYFPVVLASLRAVLDDEYNLHGTLATTHPCAPMILVNGPARRTLGINCASNCLGQGTRANAAIGRALALILLNIGGARPGIMDRATHGSPAKFTYCFGENEEESPWPPYHVRRGFAPSNSVVTVMAAEPPHNINDHASTSGEGLITTIANSVSQSGSNNVYGKGPLFVVIGPEHAQTLHRDGWTVPMIQEAIYERSRVHVSRVSKENQENYASREQLPVDDRYYVAPSPDAIHVVVAGGAGKHSAWIPSFGRTAAASVRVAEA